MIDEDAIRYRWETVGRHLDERGRRLFAAAEVRTAGWGGLAVVSQITGLARSTINRGEDDIDAGPLPEGRQARRAGGGRKAVSERDAGLVPAAWFQRCRASWSRPRWVTQNDHCGGSRRAWTSSRTL
jgi:hypothetical protein